LTSSFDNLPETPGHRQEEACDDPVFSWLVAASLAIGSGETSPFAHIFGIYIGSFPKK
jgi:hypothetical protein